MLLSAGITLASICWGFIALLVLSSIYIVWEVSEAKADPTDTPKTPHPR